MDLGGHECLCLLVRAATVSVARGLATAAEITVSCATTLSTGDWLSKNALDCRPHRHTDPIPERRVRGLD
jgi:hypothetical protein